MVALSQALLGGKNCSLMSWSSFSFFFDNLIWSSKILRLLCVLYRQELFNFFGFHIPLRKINILHNFPRKMHIHMCMTFTSILRKFMDSWHPSMTPWIAMGFRFRTTDTGISVYCFLNPREEFWTKGNRGRDREGRAATRRWGTIFYLSFWSWKWPWEWFGYHVGSIGREYFCLCRNFY